MTAKPIMEGLQAALDQKFGRVTKVDVQAKPPAAPYPFCRTPTECAGKGYCPKEIACND